MELSGQGTEGDCDGGTARGSARSRGRGTGTPRPPSSGNSGHCRGCSVRGWTGYRQKQLSDRMKDGGRPDRTLSEPRLGSAVGEGSRPEHGGTGGWAGGTSGWAFRVNSPGRLLAEGRPGTRSPRGRRRRGAWLGVGGVIRSQGGGRWLKRDLSGQARRRRGARLRTERAGPAAAGPLTALQRGGGIGARGARGLGSRAALSLQPGEDVGGDTRLRPSDAGDGRPGLLPEPRRHAARGQALAGGSRGLVRDQDGNRVGVSRALSSVARRREAEF